MYNLNKYMMDINIETLTGNSFQLKVSPNDSIESVKVKIQRLESIPVSHQDLIWQSTELNDNCTLKDYNIPDGATLKMVLKLRGGPINSRRSMQLTTEDLFLRDVSELIECREDLNSIDSYAINRNVTFLIFKDGDHYNLLRVVDKDDSPPSGAMSATSMYQSDEKEVDEDKVAENELTKEKLKIIRNQLKKINRTLNANNKTSLNNNENNKINQQENQSNVDINNNSNDNINTNNNNNNNNKIVHNPLPPTNIIPTTATASIQNIRLKRFNSLNIIPKASSGTQESVSDKTTSKTNNTETNADNLIAISSSNNNLASNENGIETDTKLKNDAELDAAAEALFSNEILNNNIKKSLIKYSHFNNNNNNNINNINEDDDIDDEDDVDDADDYDQDIDDIAQELLNKSIFVSNIDLNNNNTNNLIKNNNLVKSSATSKKLLLSSSSATSSAANNYYLQNINLNDENLSKYNKKNSLKCVSSADSLISRNNTSSKMLQSAISIQNHSSLDDLTSSSALMNNHKQYTNDNLKTSDINLTPAPLQAQFDENNNLIINEEISNNNSNNNITKDDIITPTPSTVTQTDALSSYLQKRLNLIVSRSTLSNDEPTYSTQRQQQQLQQQQQQDQQQQQQQQQQSIKTSFKRLPPKFGVLYANKTSNKLNSDNNTNTNNNNNNNNIEKQLQQKQTDNELAQNEETTYSLISNPKKSQFNLSLSEGPKIPPSLHHPLYQYPTATTSTTTTTASLGTAHLQLNPLLLGRNPVTTSSNSTNSLSTSNAGNRFEILMKNANTKTSILNPTKEDRLLASPDRLLSARSKKLPSTTSTTTATSTTTTTTKLPPVKTKVDPSKYCYACHRKTGIATSYSCRCGNNFCSMHRNAEAHNCTFDYKTEGRKILEHSNPLVAAPKLPKI